MLARRISLFIVCIFSILISACGPTVQPPVPQALSAIPTPGPTEAKVTFKSGDLTLVAYVYKPAGDGPFPALVWNHGREAQPDEGSEFDTIAAAFVPAGYVVFAPVRRGQGSSEGESLQDELDEEKSRNGEEAAEQLFPTLMQGEQLDDQLAGLQYLKSLPYVDKNRIGVMGCSDGGIATLYGAASNAGYRAALAISPGSDLWAQNGALQASLMDAVQRIDIPVFFIHPSQDVSKDPGRSLARQFEALGKTYQLKLYTPFGTPEEQTQCFGGASGVEVWRTDALFFFRQVMQ